VFNIGPAELLIIGLVLLIAVGPEQLPSVIRRAGSTVAQFRSMTDGLRSEFMAGLDEIERATDIERWSAEDSDVGKGDAATRRSAAKDTSAGADRPASADQATTGGGTAASGPEPPTGPDQVADTLFTDPGPDPRPDPDQESAAGAPPAAQPDAVPEAAPDAGPDPLANGANSASEGGSSESASPAETGEATS